MHGYILVGTQESINYYSSDSSFGEASNRLFTNGRNIPMNFSERNTPSTSDLNPSGGTSQTNEMNCRSSAGTSGYNCGADTSSSDWSIGSIGKTRRLYMSETPLPGVTRTLQANFPSGTDYWCAEILLCRCIVTFKI